MLGTIAAIHRYPVKSLAGEALESVTIEDGGIPGDRAAALFVVAGHVREGRTFRGKEHELLHTTRDPSEAAAFAQALNVAVELRAGSHYFDVAPVSLIFDCWVAELENALHRPLDFRRWRPNLFAKAAPDFAFREDAMTGLVIETGTAVLRVRCPIERCVTPSYDLVTGESDNELLRYLAQERANIFGVYCDVELAGEVRDGDALRLRER